MKCRWTNLGGSLDFSVECLKDVGFVNLRNIAIKRRLPMATVLKQCVFCGKKIDFAYE